MPSFLARLVYGTSLIFLCHSAQATDEAVIASFTGGWNGQTPGGGLVSDTHGVLYGMLQYGGMKSNYGLGKGMVYSLTPTKRAGTTEWKARIIYRFGSVPYDGEYPWGSLILDANGNLYGTTAFGGHCSLYPQDGCGTVFELSPPPAGQTLWTGKVLYRFRGQNDGVEPLAGLVSDKAGHLYGTTSQGGPGNNGTVFRLTPSTGAQTTWTKRTLFDFADPSYGSMLDSSLLLDKSGALIGTAPAGGTPGSGVVFKISPSKSNWTASVLYAFPGYPQAKPQGGVIAGNNGVLYGTSFAGGTCSTYEFGCGQVFALTPSGDGSSWSESTIYSFQAGAEGSFPTGRLIMDSTGTLYGTAGAASGFYGEDTSTAFRLAPPTSPSAAWTYTILHSFTQPGDGIYPAAGLVADADGNLYGTTQIGGANQLGAAYAITGSGFKPRQP